MKDKKLEAILAAVYVAYGKVDAIMALRRIMNITTLVAKATLEKYIPDIKDAERIVEENKPKKFINAEAIEL